MRISTFVQIVLQNGRKKKMNVWHIVNNFDHVTPYRTELYSHDGFAEEWKSDVNFIKVNHNIFIINYLEVDKNECEPSWVPYGIVHKLI